MLKNKIKAMLIILGLVITISISMFGGIGHNKVNNAYATGNTYSVTQKANDLKDVKNVLARINGATDSGIKAGSRGKIILYNSHSCEKNIDSTVEQVTSDLKLKLEKKGFTVEQNVTKFADLQGYNRSYYSSGAWLKTIDLTQYVFICDIHMDATPSTVVANFKNSGIAKLMFPNLSENTNLKHETDIVNRIKKGLETFSDKIYQPQSTNFRQGIIFYNLDKNPNMALIELGSNMNNFLECRKTNTLLASAIERAFK